MTTPSTTAGKIVTIIYGFIGCSLNVLCMNLLLERHIVFYSEILTGVYKVVKKLKAKFAFNVVHMER